MSADGERPSNWPQVVAGITCLLAMIATRPADGGYCKDTGRNGSEYRRFTKIFDLGRIPMKKCDFKCHECMPPINDMQAYIAFCESSKYRPNKKLGCSSPIEPCKSETDTNCHPLLHRIQKRSKCKMQTIDNGIVKDDSDVYCERRCASGVVQKQNGTQMRSGCHDHIISWLVREGHKWPKDYFYKSCIGSPTCSFGGYNGTSISKSKPDNSEVKNGTFCMETGMIDRIEYHSYRSLQEMEDIRVTECSNAEHKCIECTPLKEDMQRYVSMCGNPSDAPRNLSCQSPVEACKSTADTSCHPELTLLRRRKWNTCKSQWLLNGVVETEFTVFCSRHCASAVVAWPSNTVQMRSGCVEHVTKWMNDEVKKVPGAKQKLCDSARTCSFENSTSTAIAITSTTTPTPASSEAFCMQTGMIDSVTYRRLEQVNELVHISVTKCSNVGHVCTECTPQNNDMHQYIAMCGLVSDFSRSNLSCQSPVQACKSTTDSSCYPELDRIRKLKACESRFIVNGTVKLDSAVHCSGRCASAIVAWPSNTAKIRSGCHDIIYQWMKEQFSSISGAEKNFCPISPTCRLIDVSTSTPSTSTSTPSTSTSTPITTNTKTSIRTLITMAKTTTTGSPDLSAKKRSPDKPEIKREAFCMQTGMIDSVTYRRLEQVNELVHISVTKCSNVGHVCTECTPQNNDMHQYIAMCGLVSDFSRSNLSCQSPVQACKSTTDSSCYPELDRIRKLKACESRFIVNGTVKLDSAVHCSGRCASAIVVLPDRTVMNSGCRDRILSWMNGEIAIRNSSGILQRFCEDSPTCSIDFIRIGKTQNSGNGSNVLCSNCGFAFGLSALCLFLLLQA